MYPCSAFTSFFIMDLIRKLLQLNLKWFITMGVTNILRTCTMQSTLCGIFLPTSSPQNNIDLLEHIDCNFFILLEYQTRRSIRVKGQGQ